MKVLIDENLSPRWEKALTLGEISATHWMRIGKIGAPDEVIFTFAAENNYVVLS